MRVLSTGFYPGPNRHTWSSAFEAIVWLGPLASVSTAAHPRFVQTLVGELPGLADHYCSRGESGGFSQRLREGTYLGHVAEHVALELLYRGGESGTYGKTREIGASRVRIVIESETESGGRLAVDTAARLVTDWWQGTRVNTAEVLAEFRQRLAQFRLGPSTAAIVAEARRRGIPVWRMDESSRIRLGQGCRQRRIMATVTDGTSLLGMEAAQDKDMAKTLLADAGIVVPPGTVVDCASEAWAAAEQLGLPVAVKPLRGRQGQAVSLSLATREAVCRAAEYAMAVCPGQVLVERHVGGRTFRLLVVGGEVVAAAERIPPRVVGDGVHSVQELVDRLNADPDRGVGHGFPLSRVELDPPALWCLDRQTVSPDSVVPSGLTVWLRDGANMSTGATAVDVTDRLHPDIVHEAVRAAQAVGLDIAGVDIVTPDPAQPLATVGGAVIEVNAGPGLRMHLYPSAGTPRPVAAKIVDYLFPAGQGRIPVATVTGTNGKTTVARMLGHMWQQTAATVGMATTDGIIIGGRMIKAGDMTGPWAARLILNDPTVEVAVLETARGGMARHGLGFDDCDVAVVTNIGPDHLGQDGVHTLDDLVRLKSLLVETVRPEGYGVFNADDPYVMGMIPRCRGTVVLFATTADNARLRAHRHQGGHAVCVKGGYLVWARGHEETRIIGTRAMPASLGGVAGVNVANAAAAAAAALAMGMGPRQVARALASFSLGHGGMNRGRLEVYEQAGLTVLLDYAHNAPAVRAVGQIVGQWKAAEVVTVMGLPGDRRNRDIQETAREAARFSHRLVVREDADRRGRRPGEVAELIRSAVLAEDGWAADRLAVVWDEPRAIRTAIESARAGSLVLVLFERYGAAQTAVVEAMARRAAGVEDSVLWSPPGSAAEG